MSPSAIEGLVVSVWDARGSTDASSIDDPMPTLIANPLNTADDLWAQWVRKGQIHDGLIRERLRSAALLVTVAMLLGLAVATSLF